MKAFAASAKPAVRPTDLEIMVDVADAGFDLEDHTVARIWETGRVDEGRSQVLVGVRVKRRDSCQVSGV